MHTGKNKYLTNMPMLMAMGTLLLSLTACDKPKQKPAAKPAPPNVVVSAVKQETVPVYMDVPGTVKPVKTVQIVPRVSGYIFERKFIEGTQVKEGDPLYLIDPRPYQAKLDSLRATLKQHQASLKFWTNEAARYTRLTKQGAASVEDKEKFITKKAEVIASIAADRANIESAKLDLSFTKITAPFNGRIQDTLIHVGDVVSKQTTRLTSVIQVDPIYVISNISREQVYKIQQLQQQGFAPKEWKDFNAELIMPDGSTYSQKGSLNYTSTIITPSTDTLKVRYQFPNPKVGGKRALIPGQYIPLRMIAGHRPKTLLIPGKALLQTQEGMHVYVIGQDNKVEKRMVTIGDSYQQQWIIQKGLKAGEQVMTDGLQKVRPGIEVTIVDANMAKADK